MANTCVVCLILIANTCLAGIIIETSKSDESDNLVEITVQVLTSCYKNQIQTVGLAGNTPGNLLRALQLRNSLLVTLIDNSSRNVNNAPVGRESQYKLQLFVVAAASSTQLKQILGHIEDSPWWNHMAYFFIVDWSNNSKQECLDISKFLLTAWEMNLLNAKLMCPHWTKGLLIYSYNPYTSQAPDPWRLEDILKGKNNHPWSLFVREYREGDEICKELDFRKTRNLGGYEICATVKEIGRNFYIDINRTGVDSLIGNMGVFNRYIVHGLNATLNLSIHKLSDGPGYSSGNVTDLVTELINGPSEILFSLRLLAPVNNITFTYPFVYLKFHFMTQHRGYESPEDKIRSVIDGPSRLGLLVVALVTLIFLKCFLRQTLIFAIMNMLRIACNSSLLKLPTNLPSRIYLASLFFLYVTILGIYQGKIASILTMQTAMRNVDTMQDIADLGYTIYAYESLSYLFTEPEFQKRFIGIKDFLCVPNVLRDPMCACIVVPEDDAVIDAKLAAKLRLHVSKAAITEVNMVYPIRKNWPLEQRLNGIIMALVESGISRKMFAENNERVIGSEKYYEKLDNRVKFDYIILSELSFAFRLLVVGLACASLCFIIELTIEGARTNERRYYIRRYIPRR